MSQPNYTGHQPATMGNTIGACLADAKYLLQLLPNEGRARKAAVTLIEKLGWCVNLERERSAKSSKLPQTNLTPSTEG